MLVGALEVGEQLVADLGTEAVVPLVPGSRVVHLHVAGDLQPRQQHFGLLVVKDVLLLGQDAVELSGEDVDAQVVQLFQEQWLGDVLVVILRDDETDQGRSEVALGSDTFGQWGHQVAAVGTPPAFAAVTGDPRADLQILNHEVFVTFEG